MNALIENGIADRAQPHFQLLHLDFGTAITLFCHHLFAVNRPTFDECATLKNCADQCGGAKFIRVRQLQVMSRHRLMHGEIAHHVIVVFPEERFFAFL